KSSAPAAPTEEPAATAAASPAATVSSPTATTAAPSPAARGKLGTSSGVATTIIPPKLDPLPGVETTITTGTLDRSAYIIEVPKTWNGELVLYAHGFAGFGTEVSVQPIPDSLRRYLATEGFAWAASSYSENGYDPG
ncbi:MAG TPA: hypothetical protein PKI89_00900, partial [Tepidiformaceae bacterium]|nr:hypothetical protein [Tepidiformaceae bacterium]